MNSKAFLTTTLLLGLAISGCGKKSVEGEGNSGTETKRSIEEINFENLTNLKRSLETGNLELLQDVLRKSPSMDLNIVLSDGETMLTQVIKKDFRALRDFLIEKGASVEKSNANKETPLIAAVITGHDNSARILLDKNVDLNKKDAQGSSALHHAITFLADTNATNTQKKTSENLGILLIKSGASVEVTNSDDKNAYRLAMEVNSLPLQQLIRSIMEIEYGTPDLGTFRSVLQSGDINSLNIMLTRYPNMPLLYEAINPIVIALGFQTEITTLKMLQLLISYKAPVNGPADAEMTPVVKATTMNNIGFVRLLLDAGANAQSVDREGKSALYYAILQMNAPLVDILVRGGAFAKYPYRKDAIRFDFDACKMIKTMEKTNDQEPAKSTLKEMKTTLRCRNGLFGGLLPF